MRFGVKLAITIIWAGVLLALALWSLSDVSAAVPAGFPKGAQAGPLPQVTSTPFVLPTSVPLPTSMASGAYSMPTPMPMPTPITPTGGLYDGVFGKRGIVACEPGNLASWCLPDGSMIEYVGPLTITPGISVTPLITGSAPSAWVRDPSRTYVLSPSVVYPYHGVNVLGTQPYTIFLALDGDYVQVVSSNRTHPGVALSFYCQNGSGEIYDVSYYCVNGQNVYSGTHPGGSGSYSVLISPACVGGDAGTDCYGSVSCDLMVSGAAGASFWTAYVLGGGSGLGWGTTWDPASVLWDSVGPDPLAPPITPTEVISRNLFLVTPSCPVSDTVYLGMKMWWMDWIILGGNPPGLLDPTPFSVPAPVTQTWTLDGGDGEDGDWLTFWWEYPVDLIELQLANSEAPWIRYPYWICGDEDYEEVEPDEGVIIDPRDWEDVLDRYIDVRDGVPVCFTLPVSSMVSLVNAIRSAVAWVASFFFGDEAGAVLEAVDMGGEDLSICAVSRTVTLQDVFSTFNGALLALAWAGAALFVYVAVTRS